MNYSTIVEEKQYPPINTTIFPSNYDHEYHLWTSTHCDFRRGDGYECALTVYFGNPAYRSNSTFIRSKHSWLGTGELVRLVRGGQLTISQKEEFTKREILQAEKEVREAALKAEQEREEVARRNKEENERQAKYQKFRKHMKEGDDTTDGVVIEIKGSLVKIQTNDSQCTQRDYDGGCRNYVNTPVEKWFKKSEIYPRN